MEQRGGRGDSQHLGLDCPPFPGLAMAWTVHHLPPWPREPCYYVQASVDKNSRKIQQVACLAPWQQGISWRQEWLGRERELKATSPQGGAQVLVRGPQEAPSMFYCLSFFLCLLLVVFRHCGFLKLSQTRQCGFSRSLGVCVRRGAPSCRICPGKGTQAGVGAGWVAKGRKGHWGMSDRSSSAPSR